MSDFSEMADDQERWEHEKGSEPQWVVDMCNLPWVVMSRRDGSLEIITEDNLVILKMAPGNPEIQATIANVICDQMNRLLK